MLVPPDCPEFVRWLDLLEDMLPAEEKRCLEHHLESCAACQERIHGAQRCPEALRQVGRLFGDPTAAPADATLRRILHDLRQGEALSPVARLEPADLFFLCPHDRAESLGTLGRYDVQEVIGQGGMGIVLKAFDPALDRVVAIKVLAPALAASATARQRFTREAQAAAAIRHDHVVTIHDVDETDGLPYLVMQYVAGESLQARLDRVGPLELGEVIRIGMQTAAGLAAAHARSLIHRDIKPANLLLESRKSVRSEARGSEEKDQRFLSSLPTPHSSLHREAHVRITDFGLVRTADEVGLTQSGVVVGTPEYMAPEQARGEPADHRADLFSLGSVLYALCTGRPPFRGPTVPAALHQVREATPPALRSLNPEVPAWLDRLIVRLMAKEPAARISSAAEVAALLEGYLAHLDQPKRGPVPRLPPLVAESTRRFGGFRRQSRIGWLIGLFVLALAPLGALLFQAAPSPEPSPPGEFYQDFRGGRSPQPPLELAGPDAAAVTRPEEEGFRVTLPPTRRNKDRAGLVLNTRVKGDFEITSSYEILQTSEPVIGHGVAFDVVIETDTPRNDVVEVARARRVGEGEAYTCARISTDDDGKRTFQHHFLPASGNRGRLRATRLGREVTLWAAEGQSADFKELTRYDLGPEDVIKVSVTAFPGYAANLVDLRILDLQVHLLSASEAGARQTAPAGDSYGRSRGWLRAALLLAGGVVLLTLGVWYATRRNRRAEKRSIR